MAEIKSIDPDSEVTEYYIRSLVKSGAVPVVWAGNKALINLDAVLELLRHGTSQPQTEVPICGGIRKIDVKNPK